MMVCKSRPEVNIQAAIGQYEFSVVPRSLFSPDGTMLHCSSNSDLLHILENKTDKNEMRSAIAPESANAVKVSVVDGMGEVQSCTRQTSMDKELQTAG
jgi:hypothetical protein